MKQNEPPSDEQFCSDDIARQSWLLGAALLAVFAIGVALVVVGLR